MLSSPGDKDRDSSVSTKRRRVKTSRFEFDGLDNEEQKRIQQAIKNSKRETKRNRTTTIPPAPVYHPSHEEFSDPLKYIEMIRSEAEGYGICKIVPPAGWNPPCKADFSNPKKFRTKLQIIKTLQEGQKGFDEGRDYDIASYKKMAEEFSLRWASKYNGGVPMTREDLAKDYWDIVEVGTKEAVVEYGNDLDTSTYTSGFIVTSDFGVKVSASTSTAQGDAWTEEDYARSGWNLTRLPFCQDSLLRFIQTPVNGVNVPWLYVGMLFASFCWHTEDNFLYSMNYSHFGEGKQWYAVPGSQARSFEKVANEFLMESFQESPDLLHHMTTQISPSLFTSNGVDVFEVSQEAGTFIITFPRAFHAGFSYGFNVGEAVNFATADWLTKGVEAEKTYALIARPSVFSQQRLLFTLLSNLDELHLSMDTLLSLANEIHAEATHELSMRPFVFERGVRDLETTIDLGGNDFHLIDQKALEYDDMRSCCICKNVCVFSAVACECDQLRITCMGHFTNMCKCPPTKKYLLCWASDAYLEDVRAKMDDIKRRIHTERSAHKRLPTLTPDP